jgi:hypothetical protein
VPVLIVNAKSVTATVSHWMVRNSAAKPARTATLPVWAAAKTAANAKGKSSLKFDPSSERLIANGDLSVSLYQAREKQKAPTHFANRDHEF